MSAMAARVAQLELELAAHMQLLARLRAGVDTAKALAEFDAAQAQPASQSHSQAQSQAQSQSQSQSQAQSQSPSQSQSQSPSHAPHQPRRRARPVVSESSGVTEGSGEMDVDVDHSAPSTGDIVRRVSRSATAAAARREGDAESRPSASSSDPALVRHHESDTDRAVTTGNGENAPSSDGASAGTSGPVDDAPPPAAAAVSTIATNAADTASPVPVVCAPVPLPAPVIAAALITTPPISGASLSTTPSVSHSPSTSPCPTPPLQTKQHQPLKPSKPLKKDRVTLIAKCTEPTPGQTRYWTQAEHDRFLEAVRQHGEKAYVAISNYVETRTPKQVRTHAQKFQMKMARLAKGGVLTPGGAPPPHTRGSGKAAKLKAAKAKAEAAKAATTAAAAAAAATIAVKTAQAAQAAQAAVAAAASATAQLTSPSEAATAAASTTASATPTVSPVIPCSAAVTLPISDPAVPVGMPLAIPVNFSTTVPPTSTTTVLSAAAATAAAVVEARTHIAASNNSVVSPLTPHPAAPTTVNAGVPGPLTIVAAVTDDSVEDSEATTPTDAAEAVMLLEGMSSDEDMGTDSGDPVAADAYMSYIGSGGRDLEDLEDVAVLATSPFGDGGEEWLAV